jgi:DNA excision repair protein ERCC-8
MLWTLNKSMDDSTSILISILSHSLLSGGADSVINIWDLETESHDQETAIIDTLATIPQYSSRIFYDFNGRHKGHEFAITAIRWWPFDTGMFTSTSFDKYLKIWDTNTLEVFRNKS